MPIVKPTKEKLQSLESQAVRLKADIAFCREVDKLEKSGALKIVRANLKQRMAAIDGALDNFLGMEHDKIIAMLQRRVDVKLQAKMYEPQGKRIEAYERRLQEIEGEIVEYRKRLRKVYGKQ